MMQLTNFELSIILSAKDLLTDPGCCVFGAPACDDSGNRLKPTDPRATHWCLMGAIARFSPGGLIPYNALRHIDDCFVALEPILSEDFTFEAIYDQLFSHDQVLQFFDFMLQMAVPTPVPTSQHFSAP